MMISLLPLKITCMPEAFRSVSSTKYFIVSADYYIRLFKNERTANSDL